MRVAAHLGTFLTDRPCLEAVTAAADFDAVDLPDWTADDAPPPEALAAACRSAGTPLLSLAAGPDAASPDPETAEAAMIAAIAYAEAAGAAYVHVPPAGSGGAERMLDLLHDATERAAVAGLDLLIGPGADGPETVDEILDYIAAPNLLMALDLGALDRAGRDPLADLAAVADRTGHVIAATPDPGHLARIAAVWSGSVTVAAGAADLDRLREALSRRSPA